MSSWNKINMNSVGLLVVSIISMSHFNRSLIGSVRARACHITGAVSTITFFLLLLILAMSSNAYLFILSHQFYRSYKWWLIDQFCASYHRGGDKCAMRSTTTNVPCYTWDTLIRRLETCHRWRRPIKSFETFRPNFLWMKLILIVYSITQSGG